MSAFWKLPTSLESTAALRRGKYAKLHTQPRAQCLPFPAPVKSAASELRVRHEILVQPRAYFEAIARHMHAELEFEFPAEPKFGSRSPVEAWLEHLRTLHACARSESERLLTWIYVTHFSETADAPSGLLESARRAVLAEFGAHDLSTPSIRAAERALREVGSAPSLRPLLSVADAAVLIESLGCAREWSSPRWLAFSAAEPLSMGAAPSPRRATGGATEKATEKATEEATSGLTSASPPSGRLTILENTLLLRSLLGGDGTRAQSSEIGRRSSELVHRIAAAWLVERAPEVLRVAQRQRVALYDAILVHDARSLSEEFDPARIGPDRPYWLDRALVHEQLELALGPTMDLALSMAAGDRRFHAGARADSAPSSTEPNQAALFEYVSGILRGEPDHGLLAEVLRPRSNGPAAASVSAADSRGRHPQELHVRAMSLIGSAIRLQELQAWSAATPSPPKRGAKSRTAEPSSAATSKVSPARMPPAVASPRRGVLPFETLLSMVGWLSGTPERAEVDEAPPQEVDGTPLQEHVRPLARGTGAWRRAWRLGTFFGSLVRQREPHPTLEPWTGSREATTTETSLARAIRNLAGDFLPQVDAALAAVELGTHGALPRFAALSPEQFATLASSAALPPQAIDLIRIGLLRGQEIQDEAESGAESGAKSEAARGAKRAIRTLALMPEFGQPDRVPNAWCELWDRLTTDPSLALSEPATRDLIGFSAAELDRLPSEARKAYLLAYLEGLGADADIYFPVPTREPRKSTPSQERDLVQMGRWRFVDAVVFAAAELPSSTVLRHLPLRALAAALPQDAFDRLPASDHEVAGLFEYSGPSARSVWTRAWRRLTERTGDAGSTGTGSKDTGSKDKGSTDTGSKDNESTDSLSTGAALARAAVLRSIDQGRLTLRALRVGALERLKLERLNLERLKGDLRRDTEGEIAHLLTADDAISRQLARQVADSADISFLARVGGERVIETFDDAMVAQLVHAACDGDEDGRFAALLARIAKRARAAVGERSQLTVARLKEPITRGDRNWDNWNSSVPPQCEALWAVHRHVEAIAARVCTGTGATMKPAPELEAERRTLPGHPANGPRLPVPQPARNRADIARALLRIIGLSFSRCEISLPLVQQLTRIAGGRDAAELMRGAVIGRRQVRRGKVTVRKAIDDALGVALELSHEGLADEFPQLVDAQLADVGAAEPLDARYVTHRIQKKRGGIREIHEPDPDLKRLQRKILWRMLSGVPVSKHAHGFIPCRGTRTNAAAHVRQRVVLNVDIRNFFGSLPIERVRAAIAQVRRGALSPAAVDLLVRIVTRAGTLPQGAPTSPAITNIALRHVDGILHKACTRVGIRYTRYADDLTFSGADGPVQRIVPLVRDVLRPVGLELHPDKTHVYRSGRRQLVTGLVVNDRPNLPRRDRRKLRAAAHALSLGRTMHWNGAAMTPSSFTGRLAYLATVSAEEAKALRIRAGLDAAASNEDGSNPNGTTSTEAPDQP